MAQMTQPILHSTWHRYSVNFYFLFYNFLLFDVGIEIAHDMHTSFIKPTTWYLYFLIDPSTHVRKKIIPALLYIVKRIFRW